jgi:uncharacterized protein (DUF4415 family)
MAIVKIDLAEAKASLKDRDWSKFDATTDEDIARQIADNPDAAPELTREWFENAALMDGDTLVRRGRPKSAMPKKLVSLRLDQDVVDRFRATGPGWQSRINETLRGHLPK